MTTTTRDVTLDETLRLLRGELAREFPGVRFSIRRARGTAYGYVDVSWNDGPTDAAVSEITRMYEGTRFDGMTDSESSVRHVAADHTGTPYAIRYGTRGILTQRRVSDAVRVPAYRFALRFMSDWQTPTGYPTAREYADTASDADILNNARRYRNSCGTDAAMLAGWIIGGTAQPCIMDAYSAHRGAA